MGTRSPHNERTKVIGLAIGASICAAVATMFVPTALLEAITGATGLSELVPATAAPLGDKARAMIAFAAGAVTMMVALGFLSRKNINSQTEVKTMAVNERADTEDNPLFSQIIRRFGGFKGLKMPWKRNAASNDVYELSDLPELRAQDAHPDTPRRRPISAASDFGDVGLDGKRVYMPDVPLPTDGGSASFSANAVRDFVPEAAEQVSHDDMPFFADRDTEFLPADMTAPVQFVPTHVTEFAAVEFETPSYAAPMTETVSPAAAATKPAEVQPSLAELVASFEQALENRKAQLVALEALAAQMAAKIPPQTSTGPSDYINPVPTTTRPPLEAVPASVRQDSDDDMDAALNAALATLQRMNTK